MLWKDIIWSLHSSESLSILALLISELPENGLIRINININNININLCLRKSSLYDLELPARSDPHQCCLHLLLVRDSNGDFLNVIREKKKGKSINVFRCHGLKFFTKTPTQDDYPFSLSSTITISLVLSQGNGWFP